MKEFDKTEADRRKEDFDEAKRAKRAPPVAAPQAEPEEPREKIPLELLSKDELPQHKGKLHHEFTHPPETGEQEERVKQWFIEW